MRFTIVILGACLCLNAWSLENDIEAASDEDIVAAAEKLSEEKSISIEPVATETDAKAETKAESKTAAQSEAETPVFAKTEVTRKSEKSFGWRLAGSVGFILVIGGIMIFAGRKWAKQKNKGGEKVRIESLHTYHLSPKRSLNLIRVAGEVILIGSTDQSVNFIKSVSLIDDELEGVLGKDFNNFLEDDFSIEDVRSANTLRA